MFNPRQESSLCSAKDYKLSKFVLLIYLPVANQKLQLVFNMSNHTIMLR